MAMGGTSAGAGGGQPIIIQGIQPQQLNFQGGQLIQAQMPQLANQIFINANHHHAAAAASPLPTSAPGTPGPQQHPQGAQQAATIQIHTPNLSQQVAQQHHQQQVQQQVQQVQQIQMQSATPSNN